MKINTKELLNNRKYCEKIFKFFIKIKAIIPESDSYEKYLNKSLKNLEFANFILDEHKHSIKKKLPNKTFYDWCITIYYYSIYHTALALVSKAGYKSRNHLATITLITLFYYHKDNLLKKQDIEFLINNISLDKGDIDLVLSSKGLRERACYGVDELFELNQTKLLQRQTADFVNKIKQILEELE